jgi:protein lifeguard
MSTGTVVLQATILTAAAVLGLTLFTFWGVKRGYDFTFTFPFLFACLVVLLVYIIIQVNSPACLPDEGTVFLVLK